ncbi:DEAD/DEAH box helicase [Klebsiella pneumoniae]|uniref:DEAD/DEAH box helicase n=1 Tax=Klebsiella pneumoniae complex TaxID=3390273 RepID=UPI000742343A|nr:MULTISPECIES: DEAD/DEAH box helicase [Klebsiella]HCM3839961.1 DEAD/DEAH box helicase [Klebsiella quasipneumoniae]EKZ9876565.1 DEAD/DEAH box helicase [Klebsiella pneumoniae]ELA0424114.1 DEAD/DEAH box helicase [Klebsiella pneumoniae]KSW86269.1 helicase [Klebsiella pneumoniae]MBC4513020.1 DEAD/DEAH box helicase [Klebsiella pneumoniae]
MTVRIVSNAVNAMVSGADDNVKRLVQEMLSYEVEAGDWKGTSTMFNWSKNAFPAGFAKSVAANLEKAGIKCVHIRKDKVPALGKPNPAVNPFPYNPDYAYQDQAVETLVREGMMIAQIATGGGKSNVACKAAARIGRMTLFLTTRSVLMFQMADNFQKSIDYRTENGEPWLKGQKVGIIGSGEFQVSRHINVATVQTLASFLEEPPRDMPAEKKAYHLKRRELVKRFLSSVSLLILEEAHESSGSNFYDIARLCINADYRLALTATPFMKASTEANMRLMAVAGRIEIKVTEKYLIERGILAKPYFVYHKIAYTPDEARIRAELASKHLNFRVGMSTPYQKAYQLGIVYNIGRNEAVVRDALMYRDHGLNCMTLVRIKRHGQILMEMMKESGLRVDFIYGESNQSTRQAKLNSLAAGKIDVLIGSTILDVGVDVPSVGAVILAGGGKAEVEMRQRVGRGLRAKKNQANVCFISDFIDISNKHLMSHSYERKHIIDTTPGFAEGVLPVGSSFDFGVLQRD